MNINECAAKNKANLGLSKCNIMPGLIKGMIETPYDFKVENAEDLQDPEFWNEAALADPSVRIYNWPKFRTFEDASTDPVYEDTPLDSLFIMPKKYAWRFGIKENLCIHKAMFTHNASNVRCFFLDHQGWAIGCEYDDGFFRGLGVSLINLEGLVMSDGSVSTKSILYVILEDAADLNQYGAMHKIAFANSIYRIYDAKFIQVGTGSATTLVVDALTECDETPIAGVAATDLELLSDADGSILAITALAPVAGYAGRYTLTGTDFENGKLWFKPASTLTVKPYETPKGSPITVP